MAGVWGVSRCGRYPGMERQARAQNSHSGPHARAHAPAHSSLVHRLYICFVDKVFHPFQGGPHTFRCGLRPTRTAMGTLPYRQYNNVRLRHTCEPRVQDVPGRLVSSVSSTKRRSLRGVPPAVTVGWQATDVALASNRDRSGGHPKLFASKPPVARQQPAAKLGEPPASSAHPPVTL